MNTHTAHYGFTLNTLRAALHLPQHPVRVASPLPVGSLVPTDWMERLAIWAERQPMHHRMGSYQRLR